MDDAGRAAVARARAYPYRPSRPAGAEPVEAFALGGGWAGAGPALVAFGANASRAVLEEKLGSRARVGGAPATLLGFDVAYSAHVSPYGAIPATLVPSPGTAVAVAVLRCDPAALEALDATEPNYERVELAAGLEAYRSRHGALRLDDGPVALAAVAVRGRRLPALDEPAVLERVRAVLDPASTPEDFVLAQARDPDVRHARTTTLRRTAVRWSP